MLDSNKINDNDAPESKPRLHKSVSSIFGQGAAGEQKPLKPVSAAASVSPAGRSLRLGGALVWKIAVGAGVIAVLLFALSDRKAVYRAKLERELAEVSAARTKMTERMAYALKTTQDSVNEINQLKAEFEQMKQTAVEMNKKYETVLSERFDFEAALKNKDQKIVDLNGQVAALGKAKEDLEASAIPRSPSADLVEAKAAVAPPVALEGKILIVKPANAMAVVGLGSRDGIRQGSIFEIYAPSREYVAKLVIDDVEETIAIGKISPESASGRVKENYIAELK
ncbi:MAG: hypothetical protein V1863_06545 [Candidatus Omnitrophota bacterium]